MRAEDWPFIGLSDSGWRSPGTRSICLNKGTPAAPAHIAVNEDPFIRHFTAAGLSYQFTAFIGGPVSFLIVGGATPRKAYAPPPNEWCDDGVSDHHRLIDSGYFPNALPVIRQVGNLIAAWTRQEKPYLFHFHATDDGKHRLYQRLVARHAGALANYYHYMCGREFYFVRKTGS